ncbi:MAG TPA: ABC transporter permease [Candidatus Angelobacter sp.]|nr:ABC transporter permease [Candidatus Angelobacter sp.]
MTLKEIRQTLRSLRRQRQFTIPAVLALTLGIGANVVIFTLVNQVLLRPLPYPEPQRIAMVYTRSQAQTSGKGVMALADFLDIKNNAKQFQQIAAYQVSHFNLAPSDENDAAEYAICSRATAEFFNILGVRPLLGRVFKPGDDDPGHESVVVLSESFWKRRYDGRSDVVGKIVTLNGKPYTIVGVAPSSFRFPRADVEAWATLGLDPPARRSPSFLRAIGKLRPGVSMEQAQAELSVIARNIEQAHPEEYSKLGFPVFSLTEDTVGNIRTTLWILQGVVFVVLLIAIVNVANLTFARGLGKEREIAVQTCLGAKRRHIVRLLLLESLMISAVGSALGLLLAWQGISYLKAVNPANMPRLQEVAIDYRVALFTALLGVIGAIASGLLPALRVSAPNLSESLKAGGRAGTDLRKNLRIRNALVVLEIAMCFTLLIGGGLMARSFMNLNRVDMGFQTDPANLLVVETYPSGPKYTKERRVQFYTQLIADIKKFPGVEDAAISFSIPPNRMNFANGFEIEGREAMKPEQSPAVPVPITSPGYFKTMQIPLLRGRDFAESDTMTSPPVVLISQAFAKAFFGNEDPIGKRLRESDSSDDGGARPWMEIVGMVGDVHYQGANREITPAYYRPSTQLIFPYGNYVIVRSKNPNNLISTVVQRIHAEDRSIVVSKAATMEELMGEAIKQPRFNAVLMGVFAIVALILTAIGTYGVMAYSVTQRKVEIGIRMALGAQKSDVLKQVLGQGFQLTLIGGAVGITGSIILGKSVQAFLFGISSLDPATYGLITLLLFGVAAIACYVPAKKAATVDPLLAIRED